MGRLIVIDGLDGCGKSTQLSRLHQWLDKRGEPYLPVSFPDYDSPSSALVKMYLSGAFGREAGDVNAYAASSFYAVDRYAGFKQRWGKAYADGKLIVAARYTSSNAFHQMSKLPREQWDGYLDWLWEYEFDRLGLPRPDRVIFLDMPLDIAQRLLMTRYAGDAGAKDIHERDLDYLSRCREAALYTVQREGFTRIDCGRDGVPDPPEEITKRLIAAMEGIL